MVFLDFKYEFCNNYENITVEVKLGLRLIRTQLTCPTKPDLKLAMV